MKTRREFQWTLLVALFLVLIYAVLFGVEVRTKPVFFWIANW